MFSFSHFSTVLLASHPHTLAALLRANLFALQTIHSIGVLLSGLYFLSSISYDSPMPRKSTKINKQLDKALSPTPEPQTKGIEVQVKRTPQAGESWGTVKYADAFMLWVFEGKSYAVVSKETGVPVATLKGWSSRDKWMDQRRECEQQIMEALKFEALQIYRDNRSELMLRHLQLGKNLDKTINAVLSDNLREIGGRTITDLSPTDVRELAVALKNSADVTHRVVKITDKSEEQMAGTIINGPVQVNVKPTNKQGRIIDL